MKIYLSQLIDLVENSKPTSLNSPEGIFHTELHAYLADLRGTGVIATTRRMLCEVVSYLNYCISNPNSNSKISNEFIGCYFSLCDFLKPQPIFQAYLALRFYHPTKSGLFPHVPKKNINFYSAEVMQMICRFDNPVIAAQLYGWLNMSGHYDQKAFEILMSSSQPLLIAKLFYQIGVPHHFETLRTLINSRHPEITSKLFKSLNERQLLTKSTQQAVLAFKNPQFLLDYLETNKLRTEKELLQAISLPDNTLMRYATLFYHLYPINTVNNKTPQYRNKL